MVTDAPDYQTVITLVSGGSLTDAPDWQEVVTGPGGTPPAVAAGASPFSLYYAMGMLGITIDGQAGASGRSPTSGKMVLQTFTAGATGTINHVYLYIVTGNTPTANENFLCIYDWGAATPSTYTLLGQTAAGAIDAQLHNVGILTGTLVTGVPVTSGQTYVMAILCGGAYPSITSLNTVDTHINNPFFPATPMSTVSTALFTAPPSTLAYSATIGNQTSWWALLGP